MDEFLQLLGWLLISMVTMTSQIDPDVCNSLCTCSTSQIKCVIEDSITEFPLPNSTTLLDSVTEIIIENQPRLTKIDDSLLRKFSKIKTLNLVSNGLKSFSLKSVKHLGSLEEIQLSGNPFTCDCEIKWLVDPGLQISSLRKPSRNLTCLEPELNRVTAVNTFPFENCGYPNLVMKPEVIHYAPDSQPVVVSCLSNELHLVRPVTLRYYGNSSSLAFKVTKKSDTGLELQVKGAKPEDSQIIGCVAENREGRTQKNITIIVPSAPRIVSLSEPFKGYNWYIFYEISGLPTPNITWTQNGLVRNFSSIERVKEERTIHPGKLNTLHGKLEFEITHQSYNGNYTLTIANELGNDTRIVEAIFLHPPDDEHLHNILHPPLTDEESYNSTLSENLVESLQSMTPPQTIILCVVFVIVTSLLIALIVLVVRCHQARKKKMNSDSATEAGCVNLFLGGSTSSRGRRVDKHNCSALEAIPLSGFNMVENPTYLKRIQTGNTGHPVKHISRNNIRLVRELGEGNFGRVYLGLCQLGPTERRPQAQNFDTDESLTPVAIKTLKDNHAESYRRDFDREAELLTNLNHRNIITMYGISEDGETPMIVLEYMENGDLNNYLRSHGPDKAVFCPKSTDSDLITVLTTVDLLHVSNQVAAGVAYLTSQHFVHRDLATRNCLVGRNLQVKIGDFGMSRDIYSTDYYKVGGQAMLPIRWMPSESVLYSTFTVESDVWSFGVVLWEIFSYGKQPWYELSNKEVMDHIELGRTLERPRDCPEEVYEIMRSCWRRLPSDRATMNETHSRLMHLLQQQISDDKDSPPRQYLEII